MNALLRGPRAVHGVWASTQLRGPALGGLGGLSSAAAPNQQEDQPRSGSRRGTSEQERRWVSLSLCECSLEQRPRRPRGTSIDGTADRPAGARVCRACRRWPRTMTRTRRPRRCGSTHFVRAARNLTREIGATQVPVVQQAVAAVQEVDAPAVDRDSSNDDVFDKFVVCVVKFSWLVILITVRPQFSCWLHEPKSELLLFVVGGHFRRARNLDAQCHLRPGSGKNLRTRRWWRLGPQRHSDAELRGRAPGAERQQPQVVRQAR